MNRGPIKAFQSRSGFSVFCDLSPPQCPARLDAVSIPFWVFCVLRLGDDNDREGVWGVSIPFWVFCVLRHHDRPRRGGRRQVSIPFWVFCVLRQRIDDQADQIENKFQSRSGFSVFCDRDGVRRSDDLPRVSIPFWVFCVLRHAVPEPLNSHASMFQSRSGFSVFCDGMQAVQQLDEIMFQSRSGFSVFCDTRLTHDYEYGTQVSIPFWVFCVLRQLVEDFWRVVRVSIPFWVFCVLRLFASVLFIHGVGCFNPVLGFLCSATRRDILVSDFRLVFQSRSGFSVFCDLLTHCSLRLLPPVSIPFWVFCVLRPLRSIAFHSRYHIVSIPFWVFCVLRHARTRLPRREA